MSCVASGAAALVPIPGTSIKADVALISVQSRFYYNQLGLNEKALERTAEITSSDVNVLHNIVNERVSALRTTEGIISFTRAIPYTVAMVRVEEGFRIVPIVGLLVSSVISFGSTYYISKKNFGSNGRNSTECNANCN